jgi:hypothetical protein
MAAGAVVGAAAAPAQPTSPEGTPTVVIFKPKAPKFGSVFQTSGEEFCARLGGIPKADMSGLIDGAHGETPGPDQVRPVGARCAQSSKETRVNGLLALLKTEFKQGGDVPNLEEKASKRFKGRGLGAVAHVHDPADDTKMVSVFKQHARFSVECIRDEAKKRLPGHDDCLKQSNQEAVGCLKHAADPRSLKT